MELILVPSLLSRRVCVTLKVQHCFCSIAEHKPAYTLEEKYQTDFNVPTETHSQSYAEIRMEIMMGTVIKYRTMTTMTLSLIHI